MKNMLYFGFCEAFTVSALRTMYSFASDCNSSDVCFSNELNSCTGLSYTWCIYCYRLLFVPVVLPVIDLLYVLEAFLSVVFREKCFF